MDFSDAADTDTRRRPSETVAARGRTTDLSGTELPSR
jgi:hypothetical protein